jgi:hypothetical protein
MARYPGSVDRDEILRVLQAFEDEGLEYVLIGAKDTVRPLDRQDAEALKRHFDLGEG